MYHYKYSSQRKFKQSFSFIRDKEGLSLGQDRALTSKGVVNSSGPKELHRGAQGPGYSSGLERSKCASGGTQSDKTPCFFFLPTFRKETSGFYSFTGFKLRVVDAKKGGVR